MASSPNALTERRKTVATDFPHGSIRRNTILDEGRSAETLRSKRSGCNSSHKAGSGSGRPLADTASATTRTTSGKTRTAEEAESYEDLARLSPGALQNYLKTAGAAAATIAALEKYPTMDGRLWCGLMAEESAASFLKKQFNVEDPVLRYILQTQGREAAEAICAEKDTKKGSVKKKPAKAKVKETTTTAQGQQSQTQGQQAPAQGHSAAATSATADLTPYGTWSSSPRRRQDADPDDMITLKYALKHLCGDEPIIIEGYNDQDSESDSCEDDIIKLVDALEDDVSIQTEHYELLPCNLKIGKYDPALQLQPKPKPVKKQRKPGQGSRERRRQRRQAARAHPSGRGA